MLLRVKYMGAIAFMVMAAAWSLAGARPGPQSPGLRSPGPRSSVPQRPGSSRAQTAVPPGSPRHRGGYLALGDSYTIGQSVDPADRYPSRVAQLLRKDRQYCPDPEIIATTGWTTTDLLHALDDRRPSASWSVVTLLIGVNDQYQGLSPEQYRDRFTLLLQRSIKLAGNRPDHVLVLSIPDYSVTPFAMGRNPTRIAAGIDSFNKVNASVAWRYGVHYLDVTGESRKALGNEQLIAPDGLHFSGKEYARWAQMMEPVMKSIMNDN